MSIIDMSARPFKLFINGDCMQVMKEIPDKMIDLALCDIPYGIGTDWKKRNKKIYAESSYKNEKVNKEYFDELFRISKNQIIWGYNYYTEFLGSTNYLIIWDKQSNNNQVFKYSKVELAYTDIKIPANLISIPWDGYRMGKETGIKKIHPHQKPIELSKWILQNYAKPGWLIFDSHVGSASSLIACEDMGFEYIGTELDTDFYRDALERLNIFRSQGKLWEDT